jgi:hypothetical protein
MQIKCFSIAFGLTLAAAMGVAAAPLRVDLPPRDSALDVVLAQSVKERDLEAVPPVDAGRAPPPAARTSPPAYSAPPVPPAPRTTTRMAPPPAAEDESRPPAREVPPPPSSTTRVTPPPPARTQEPTPIHRPAPRVDEPPVTATPSRRAPGYDDPPPARRADAPRRAPPTRPQQRSAFETNCTQQCHLSCEASFESCNGDSSPAKPACVKKLESCRVERCSCRFD